MHIKIVFCLPLDHKKERSPNSQVLSSRYMYCKPHLLNVVLLGKLFHTLLKMYNLRK